MSHTPIDSQVLHSLGNLLQTPIHGGETFFDSDHLQQVLDVAQAVRRGGTMVGTDGMHSLRFTQVHAIAGSQNTSLNPYTSALGPPPWPSPDFATRFLDAWLIGIRVLASSAATFDDALFTLTGLPTSGNATIAAYNANVTIQGSVFATEVGTGKIGIFPAIRIPRGGAQLDISSSASGVCTVTFDTVWGWFPIGSGQDAIGAG